MRLASKHFEIQVCRLVLHPLYQPSPVEREQYATEVSIDINLVNGRGHGIQDTTITNVHNGQTLLVVSFLVHPNERDFV